MKDLDEQITTEDLEDIEDALYEAAKERAVDLKKEEREEDLEDCEEVGGSLRGVWIQVVLVFSKWITEGWRGMFVIHLVGGLLRGGEGCLWYI